MKYFAIAVLALIGTSSAIEQKSSVALAEGQSLQINEPCEPALDVSER